jgi:hypothetical protein
MWFKIITARQGHNMCMVLPQYFTGKEQILQAWDMSVSRQQLWDMMQCQVTDMYRCSWGSGCLHHLGISWDTTCTSETPYTSTRLHDITHHQTNLQIRERMTHQNNEQVYHWCSLYEHYPPHSLQMWNSMLKVNTKHLLLVLIKLWSK